MSIEQDWETTTRMALDPDHTSVFGRCMIDLHDRLAAVQKRLGSIQSDVGLVEKEQPDPSEWVGDICMFRDDDDVAWLGPDMLTNVIGDRYYDEGSNWWEAVRPATDEERIRYKGEPPTVNGELCCVRDSINEDWSEHPRTFIGGLAGMFITAYPHDAVGNNVELDMWTYARKLTPKELKQHQAGSE